MPRAATYVITLTFPNGAARVERRCTVHERNWRRLFRRERTEVTVLGTFRDPGMKFEITRHMNRPGTFDLTYHGRTPEAFIGLS